jgi:hypothetical protein
MAKVDLTRKDAETILPLLKELRAFTSNEGDAKEIEVIIDKIAYADY